MQNIDKLMRVLFGNPPLVPMPRHKCKPPDKKTIEQLFLSVLDERGRYILTKRLGLYGHEIMTLEKLGKELGVSGERIRQIEAKSLHKIRKAVIEPSC